MSKFVESSSSSDYFHWSKTTEPTAASWRASEDLPLLVFAKKSRVSDGRATQLEDRPLSIRCKF